MTIVIRIEHPVRNFEAWKNIFDSDPLGRKKSGVRRYRIMRPNDNPNYVMADLEFDDQKKAEAFAAALRNLWGTGQAKSVVENPQLRILDSVEIQEL